MVYVAALQTAVILFMDQKYVTTPPPFIFAPPSEVVSAMLGLPYTSGELIQLGLLTCVSRYETDEQNAQQT